MLWKNINIWRVLLLQNYSLNKLNAHMHLYVNSNDYFVHFMYIFLHSSTLNHIVPPMQFFLFSPSVFLFQIWLKCPTQTRYICFAEMLLCTTIRGCCIMKPCSEWRLFMHMMPKINYTEIYATRVAFCWFATWPKHFTKVCIQHYHGQRACFL